MLSILVRPIEIRERRDIPVRRNLYQSGFLSALKGFHPRRRLLGVIDLRPRIFIAKVVGLTAANIQTRGKS